MQAALQGGPERAKLAYPVASGLVLAAQTAVEQNLQDSAKAESLSKMMGLMCYFFDTVTRSDLLSCESQRLYPF